MTDPKPTAHQIAAQALLRAEEAVALNAETHAMVKTLVERSDAMYHGFMEPHAGYGGRSLISCLGEIVVKANSGQIVGERIVWYAKLAGASSVIMTAIYALANWGPK